MPQSTDIHDGFVRVTQEQLEGAHRPDLPSQAESITAQRTSPDPVTEGHAAASSIDADKLMAFVFRAVGEVGATLNAALVVMGDQLGYYRALAATGPLTAAELAQSTDTGEKYAREWLNAQAAGEYLSYEPASGRYGLCAEYAVALTDETSPAFLPGFFQLAAGVVRDADRVIGAARSGGGIGWGEHNRDVHIGCERFFRPGYLANLIGSWLPALDDVVPKLEKGALVADLGCGYGASTIMMAQAFPQSRFVGSDSHSPSIAGAQDRSVAAGTDARVSFETASAQSFSGSGYALVTTFDALHDMGDPVGAARRVFDALDEDGTWMIVEPAAGDRVEDNLNLVGRAYYGFSTLLCTPASLSQDVGLGLGTQAGPARIRDVTVAAGFSRFRLAAQTPFNNIFEVRK